MVGVVDAAAPMEHSLGIGAEDGVRLERPDLTHQMLAQGEVIDQGTVRLVEERHALVADDFGSRALFSFTERGELERIGEGVLATLVA
jgi:hypothetical protein